MCAQRSVLIDFSEAGFSLRQDELELRVLKIAREMQSGTLVQEVHLARETDIPVETKSGTAAFLAGILKAEVSRENIGKLIDFLGNQFYGKTLVLSGDIDGMNYSIEYRNKHELDQAVDTIERLANLRIKILDGQKTSKG
jgi:hypothetical protein